MKHALDQLVDTILDLLKQHFHLLILRRLIKGHVVTNSVPSGKTASTTVKH